MGESCPKCATGRMSAPTYCTGTNGRCYRRGEHMHEHCINCQFSRTFPCADAGTTSDPMTDLKRQIEGKD